MKTIFFVLFLLLGVQTQAQALGPASFSYEGRVFEGAGIPSTATVSFVVQLLNPAGTCIIYQERIGPRSLADTNGYFSLTLGEGTRQNPNAAFSLRQIVSNSTGMNGSKVIDGTVCPYSPASGDTRKLRVIIDEAGTLTTLSPDISLGSSAYAMDADALQGIGASGFLQTNPDVTQAKIDTLMGSANWTELSALIAGTSNRYARPAANGASSLPTFSVSPSTPTAGQIWYDTVTNTVKFYNGSAAVPLAVGGATLVESNVPVLSAPGKVIGSAIVSGTIGGSTSVNTTGDVTANNLTAQTNLSAGGVSSRAFWHYNSSNSNKIELRAPALLSTNYIITLPMFPPSSNGQILAASLTGELSWVNPAPPAWQPSGGDIFFNTGRVGIGTSAPVAALHVRGQIVSEKFNATGTAINFNSGNVQVVSSVGGTAFSLSGLVEGGEYKIIVEDTTSRTYTFSPCTNRFKPANGPTTAGTHTIYKILFSNNNCYIDWASGY